MGLLDRVNGSIAYQKVSSNPDGSSLTPSGGDGATGLKGLLARQGKVLVAFFLAVGALLFYIGSVCLPFLSRHREKNHSLRKF